MLNNNLFNTPNQIPIISPNNDINIKNDNDNLNNANNVKNGISFKKEKLNNIILN